jgi:DNA-binding transcriptional ArsR family regulator
MSLDQTSPAPLAQPHPDAEAEGCGQVPADEMLARATAAAGFLKALSHEGRLMILCHLSSGEKSVTELEQLLDSRQAAVSQQLARLRLEGLVATRREGKAIYYAIQDPKVLRMITLVYDMFCRAEG